MKLVSITIFVVFISLGCNYSNYPQEIEKINNLIFQINNTDIGWGGTHYGIQPAIKGASYSLYMIGRENSLEENNKILDLLLKALKDKEKYVAAHVLLTKIINKPFQFLSTEWNGLKVHLLNNGKAEYEIDSQEKIINYWEKKKTWSVPSASLPK